MIKNLFKKNKPKKTASKPTTAKVTKTAKEIADERGEPYVEILGIEVDPDNPHSGAFELDWNDKFVSNLLRAGYQGKTDSDIVDQWFQTVCRNVVMETFEQEAAMNPSRFQQKKDLGNGRTEVS